MTHQRRTGPTPSSETGPEIERQRRSTPTVQRSSDNLLLTRHGDVEDEVFAAFLDGFAAGLHEANVRMAAAIDHMLAGPDGYGLETVSVSAKEAVRRMLRGLVGVS